MKRDLLLLGWFIWVIFHTYVYFSKIVSFEVILFDVLILIAFLIIVKKEDADD